MLAALVSEATGKLTGVVKLTFVSPIAFAGKLDRHELNLGERLVVNVVGAPDGDFRDWNAIRVWADEIGAALKSAAVPAGAVDTSSDVSSWSQRASAYFG